MDINIKDFLIYLVREYGGIALFFSHFLEFLGLPLPGETLMLISGFMSTGWLAAILIMAAGTAGTFSGSMFAYAIGYRFGEGVVLKIGRRFHITKESLNKTNAVLESHEALYLIFCRFIPGLRDLVPYIAGIIKLSRRKFIICNAISSLIWCTFFVSAGKILGQKWVIFEHIVNIYSVTALLVIVFIFLVYRFGGRFRFVIYGVFLPIFAFAAIALLQEGRRIHLFDTAVYGIIARLVHLRLLFITVTQFESLGVLAVIAAACAAVMWKNRKYTYWGVMIVVNFVSCFLLGEAANLIFRRPRPQSLGLIKVILFTFPSVNSMLSISFYGFIIYLLVKLVRRPWKILPIIFLILVIAATGASSIYLHEYNASDVIAGYSAGFSWLVLFIVAIKKLQPTLKKTGPDAETEQKASGG